MIMSTRNRYLMSYSTGFSILSVYSSAYELADNAREFL